MRWMSLFLAMTMTMAVPLAAEEIAPAMLDALPAADVVILGEVHDNPLHHIHQARAIAAIRPTAVVWEMLTTEQALNMPDDRRAPDDVSEALGWEGTGWPAFTLYYPIVTAAGSARHFGAAVPRGQARGAFAEGAAAIFAGDAALFGLGDPLPDAEQSDREQAQFEAHCAAMPIEMMGGMVEAQRLRDASLAQAAMLALAETGGPVVVITGTGHARVDWGMPALLRRAEPDARVVSVGQIEASDAGAVGGALPYDFWIVTPPHPRNDPCDAFR